MSVELAARLERPPRPKVIVVGADDDGFVFENGVSAFDDADNVIGIDGFLDEVDLKLCRCFQIGRHTPYRSCFRLRVRRSVRLYRQPFFDLSEFLNVFSPEQFGRDAAIDDHNRYRCFAGCGLVYQARKRVGFEIVRFGDHDQGFCSAFFCEVRFRMNIERTERFARSAFGRAVKYEKHLAV